MRIFRFSLIVTLAVFLAGAAAMAQPVDPRRAVQQGQALPLREILQRVLPVYRGQLLKADLMREQSGRLVYRMRILDDNGKIVIVTAAARSGHIVDAKRNDR